MKKKYETPSAELLEFDYTDVITTSNGVTKNPGHHGCTVMPNGKPIPEDAIGHRYDMFADMAQR